jgi:hypothetical protein
MKPAIKATLSLPIAIGIFIFSVYVIVEYIHIFSWIVIIISLLVIIASIWYALYKTFGGED